MKASHNKVILLVEDNPVDEELTIMAFQRHHITNEIVVAHDGVEAMDYLLGRGAYASREPGKNPQLILLDLKLPKLDGLEVLRQLRQDPVLKCTPVVILTSSKEQKDLVEAYNLGTNAYVRKPVDFNEFADAIKQLGLFWLILNECPECYVVK